MDTAKTNVDSRKGLSEALRASETVLGPFREQRRQLYERVTNAWMPRSSVAEHWNRQTPVNAVAMAWQGYTSRLVAKNPRVKVYTKVDQVRAEARELEIATNDVIREIELHRTLKLLVSEALFSMGVVKVAMTPPEHDEMLGQLHDGGQPFCDPCYLDDFMFDVNARSWESSEFFADRYRVPRDVLLESPLVSKDRHDEIRSHGQREPAGTNPSERMDMRDGLIAGTSGRDNELDEHVWLVDVFLQRRQEIETYLWDDGVRGKPLWTTEWAGPEQGPYHVLSFGNIPGTVIPFPPAATWIPMHDAINQLWRKLLRQADRQKTILGARGDAADDAKRINDAADGAAVNLTGREKPEEMRWGGPDNQIIGIAATMMQIADRQMGNLNAIAGLGPSSGTVGQDKIISEQADHKIKAMQGELHRTVKGIVTAIGDMIYADPISTRTIEKKVGEVSIKTQWGPERREADFREFNFDVVPYSMEDLTPSERAARLRELMGEIGNLAPLIEGVGGHIRADRYLENLRDLLDEPLLDGLVDFTDASLEGGEKKPRGVPLPNSTTRRYERVNRSGGPQDPMQAMMQMAQAGGQGGGQ